jgi:hypothetical protein
MNVKIPILVRSGDGEDGGPGPHEFNDVVDKIMRAPKDEKGWRSVYYKGQRYRLYGGNRTSHFICLNNRRDM